MEKPSEIEFTVDEQYENEKGVFTVVSKQRDQMVIRWENGEEVLTDIVLQQRILERRQWEKKRRRVAAEAAVQARKKGTAAKKAFTGMAATDFKKTATGTHWRARNQLGGAVTAKMAAPGFQFNSWVVGNKAEIQIQDIRHRQQDIPEGQAHFFVKVDPQTLQYGFSVAPTKNSEGGISEWDGVIAWLAQPENDALLRSLAASEGLHVGGPESGGRCTLRAAEDGWYREDNDGKTAGTLKALIGQAPEDACGGLRIAAALTKDEVVADGAAVAATVGRLFTHLLPLYRAAVAR